MSVYVGACVRAREGTRVVLRLSLYRINQRVASVVAFFCLRFYLLSALLFCCIFRHRQSLACSLHSLLSHSSHHQCNFCRDCLRRIDCLDKSRLFQKTIDSCQCFSAHLKTSAVAIYLESNRRFLI